MCELNQDIDKIPNIFEFDGRKFRAGYNTNGCLYMDMAYRARRGDVRTASLLDAYGVRLYDVDGKLYWPPADLDGKPVQTIKVTKAPAMVTYTPAVTTPDLDPPEYALTDFIPPIPPELAPRSGRWPDLRRAWLADHPDCAVCGTKKGCVPHHVKPVHLFPDLELDVNNLLTMCPVDHWRIGHLGAWVSYNPTVREDAKTWKLKIEARP